MTKTSFESDIFVYLEKMEIRLNKNIKNSEKGLRKEIYSSEKRVKEYIHEYVDDATQTVVKGMDNMFERKDKKDKGRHEVIMGEIAIMKTEHRELKKRASVLESQVRIN